MNVSSTFIRRPIATSLFMLGIALFGIVSYRALSVADMPNVDFPTLSVSAGLPGADPNTMSSAVATPLERQFTTIAGLDSMTSSSSTGSSNVTMQFDLSRDIDGAAVDLQTAIAAVMPLLPPGMPSPPSFRKQNPADSPTMFLGLASNQLPLWKVDEYAETMIAQRISMIEGVAQVNVFGAAKYAVHVQVDPNKLASRQIGINEVSDAIAAWNVNLPTGNLYGPHTVYTVQANGQLMNAEEYRPVIVAWRNGAPVRLTDVARVIDGVEDDKTASWFVTKEGTIRAINLIIMKQPSANTIAVADAVKKLIPTFQAQLPPSITLGIRGDSSRNIREAFKDIQFTMALTLVLVIGVIFLFLRNVSATMIPSMALPFSIIGTFSVMYLLNFSLNNLSMMALILSIGFVVDDAIVMLENIVRHIERGESPMEASLKGSKEISFTIVSMTLSLAAVFIPVLFMGGILGRLFREFAVTITAAILISGVVSVTLTPMLCSRFLSPDIGKNPNWFYRVTERGFDALLHVYKTSLFWVLHHRPVMLAVFVAVLVATVQLYQMVPKGFIPEMDSDRLMLTTEAAQGTSYTRMIQLQQRVNDILRQEPGIENVMSSVGGNFGNSSNQGRGWIQLTPRKDRPKSAQMMAEDLRRKLGGIPGMKAFIMVPAAIRIGGRQSKSGYEFTLQSPDVDNLYTQAQGLERQVAKLPMIQDVTSDLQIRNPRLNIEIDRDKAATLGLNLQGIEQSLYSGFGPSWVSTIYSPMSQNRVLLEMEPKYQQWQDNLKDIFFKASTGKLIPLESVTKLTPFAGPQSIAHSGQLPSVTISFNLKPGVALSSAVDAVQEVATRTLPANMVTSFQGTAKAFQDSLKNLSLLLLIAIAVVYIVLGVLYESYIHPLTILSGLPSAAFGALLTLMLFKVDLNIYAFVGLMMLIGIVKKNAIMQIDFALEAERHKGLSPRDAIFEGCLERFRPIMMTTAAALLGALPISLGYGAGGEARRPLGLTVVGGLVFSQMLTLYLTPVVYTYMSGLLDRIQGNRKQVPSSTESPSLTHA